MRIRTSHPVWDRVKVILILSIVLILLSKLAFVLDGASSKRKESTLQNMIQTALLPVGSTMYIWGGGWDNEDKTAGATSAQIGLSSQWESFMRKQDESYDFNNYRFQRENGLDCSGYVGWVVYNTFEKESGKDGYVTISTDMAKNYADRGWGTYIEHPTEFLAGDIVSMEGHVWISLGTCVDGSVLLVHSSPPGVSVCGTTLEDGTESIAMWLAKKYMNTYYPKWQEKYPDRSVPCTYLQNVSLMRWNTATMLDAKKLQALGAEDIMLLFTRAS